MRGIIAIAGVALVLGMAAQPVLAASGTNNTEAGYVFNAKATAMSAAVSFTVTAVTCTSDTEVMSIGAFLFSKQGETAASVFVTCASGTPKDFAVLAPAGVASVTEYDVSANDAISVFIQQNATLSEAVINDTTSMNKIHLDGVGGTPADPLEGVLKNADKPTLPTFALLHFTGGRFDGRAAINMSPIEYDMVQHYTTQITTSALSPASDWTETFRHS